MIEGSSSNDSAGRNRQAKLIVIRVKFPERCNANIFGERTERADFSPSVSVESPVRLTNDMLLDHNSTDTQECTAFEVQYHVRGRRKRQPLTGRCQTVQEIIDLGQRSFPAFADRNPWICIDSKHGTVFVGLDPERQTFEPEGNARMQGNVSSNQESIQQ